jgi:glutaredoxin
MFNARSILCAAVLGAAVTPPSPAVTVLQCEDEHGNRSFESACPPGTKEVGARDYPGVAAPAAAEEEEEAPPEITLYLVPECEACTQIREFLDLRQLPYTVKDVKDDAVLQQELKKRSGELRAPTVMVGEKAVVGYNRTALIATLQEAGHIEAEVPDAGATAAEPGTGAPSP